MHEQTSHGERILTIEDDDPMRDTQVVALETEGYEVESCGGGLEAIELAHQHSFDLVISDIRMAGMDGLETLERLQQQQPLVATLVITGFTAEADSIRAVRLGVGDYLKKPFGLDEFLQAVAKQLNLHRIRKQRWQRDQSLELLANWSLEAWLSSFSTGALEIRGARFAESLATELGLPPHQSGHARRAFLISRALKLVSPDFDTSGLPSDMLRILDELRTEDGSNEALTLVTRVVRSAEHPEVASDDESVLAEAFRRAQGKQASGPGLESAKRAARLRQSQLQQARAQEQGGHNPEATALYVALTEPGAPIDRCRVEALLGLMRISENDREKCRGWAQEAIQCGREVNPLVCGLASLEAGLFMAKTNHPREAISLFQNARKLGSELDQKILEAKSVLAIAGNGEPVDPTALVAALTTLLGGEAGYEVIHDAWWVVPALLRLQVESPNSLQERLLARLGRDACSRLLACSRATHLDSQAKLCLIKALSGSSHPVALEGLRSFAVDENPQVRQAADRAMSASTDEPSPPAVRIYTLGDFQAWRGDERVPDSDFRSWKQRFLLARLAGSARPIASERLMDEFWPEDAESGRASLNVAFSHLKRILRPTQWPHELDYLVRDKGRLGKNPELPFWHDLTELVRLSAIPENVTLATLEDWRQAVHLYKGPYLDNCYLEWAVQQREKAEQMILEVLRRLIAAFLERNRAGEAAQYSARLLELDPCCQEAHLALMKAHLLLKRPEAAVRQFEICKRLLRKELGMEPSIAILEYHQRALLTLS